MTQNQNQISELVTGCVSVSMWKANPIYLGMSGKKGKASSQHCIVQDKGQKGIGLILEEKKTVALIVRLW